jgi:hypothetical protein
MIVSLLLKQKGGHMKIKKWIFRLIVAVFILNVAVTISGASEKMSPDGIKFQGTGWESDANGANVFIGTLQNISGKDIEFIGLRCAFFNTKGVELDHGVVNVRDVVKDGVAAFKFYPSAPSGTVIATITEVDVYAK